MVFENIVKASSAEKHPVWMFFYGVMLSSIALFLALVIFRPQASMIMIFFTVLACGHLMYNTLKFEEQKDLDVDEPKILFKEHSRALTFFVAMFIGFVVSFSCWFLILPAQTSDLLFSTQIESLESINGPSGNAVNETSMLYIIISNNLRVLVFCLAFSFLYGIGAIFILSWNASIIAAAIGLYVKDLIGTPFLLSYPIAFSRYFIHGIPEMLAFFTAGLAGGIISIAVIKHDLTGPKAHKIVLDSLDLVIASILLLLIAAIIEVYVTPLVF